jgi:hypothetical protein
MLVTGAGAGREDAMNHRSGMLGEDRIGNGKESDVYGTVLPANGWLDPPPS